MTSFTKALYRRDPAAANEFHRQSSYEQRAAHGRPGTITYGKTTQLASFGLRQPTEEQRAAASACAAPCGHPACKYGCTRWAKS